jgi:hypothetical protein
VLIKDSGYEKGDTVFFTQGVVGVDTTTLPKYTLSL